MQKVSNYRGIEYIRISALPQEQRESIKQWLEADMIIKILTPEQLMSDCVLYKDYKHWFETIYTELSPADVETKAKLSEVKSKPYKGLAFD